MLNDSRIASNRHLRRLYELDPEATPDFGDVTCMTCPPFWEYRQPVTLENFKLFVQEKTVMNEGGSLQLLTLFLEQVLYMHHFVTNFSQPQHSAGFYEFESVHLFVNPSARPPICLSNTDFSKLTHEKVKYGNKKVLRFLKYIKKVNNFLKRMI